MALSTFSIIKAQLLVDGCCYVSLWCLESPCIHLLLIGWCLLICLFGFVPIASGGSSSQTSLPPPITNFTSPDLLL